MTKKMNVELVSFLEELLRRRGLLPAKLAKELGLRHSSVSRWLSGKQQLSFASCLKLATYADVPLESVLSMAGYLPAPEKKEFSALPGFREYVEIKYPGALDDDLITLIDELIQRRRARKASKD